MKHITVFCGSRVGASEAYKDGAILLGKELVKRDITLVYGGGSVGLMGVIANTVLKEGGNVIGVIPKFLEEREISHLSLTELLIVESMHERKAKMADLADGFIAMPGGPGTLEEFVEIFTWAQLGLHQKPLGLLNIDNFYDPFIAFFNHMAEQQFLLEKHRGIMLVDSSPAKLINKFYNYEPPAVKSYLKEDGQI
ncbi:TIGR00730 family Rossman fold protein [Pueribacillus theae]|uniref:Cytokinin riboside 5'-monophosphate phosphoribohydrolase n=1 Tax=Pueribacillus theae TaxID=2171751 RepID=A0A2U1K246_9BACI|nr:TIGR00730 family Rossman fold protein [Pueribacillus theae]PWA11239.1 TIGR00730 family Rossman fold protein [Pueribacillus theae]